MARRLKGSAPIAWVGEAEEGHEAEEQGEHEELPQQTTIEAQTAQSAYIRAARVGPGQIADEQEVRGGAAYAGRRSHRPGDCLLSVLCVPFA